MALYQRSASEGEWALNWSSDVPESLEPMPLLTSLPLMLNFSPEVDPIIASMREEG